MRHFHGAERQWEVFSFEKRKSPTPPKEKPGGIPKFPPNPLKAAKGGACGPLLWNPPWETRQRLAERKARTEKQELNPNHPNLTPQFYLREQGSSNCMVQRTRQETTELCRNY